MPLLDDDPFPKGETDAQRLVRVLAGFFREERPAVEFAALHGFDVLELPPGLSPIDRWYCILDRLAKIKRVRKCVEAARDTFPGNSEIAFLNALLAGAPCMQVTRAFRPEQYLGLFDRVVESDILAERLLGYATPPPLSPLVIGVLAERDDEYTLFLQRVRDETLRDFYGATQWQEEMIQWAPSTQVSAEYEIRKIAASKPGGKGGPIAEVLARLRGALAGRTLWLMLRSTDLRQPGIAEKLTAFLTLFGQLGQEAPPPVLCVAIVRWDDGDPPLAEAEPVVSAAFAQARAAGMIAIDPVVTLSMCDASHFDAWQYTIAAYDKNNEIDLKKLEQLKRSFNAPFRLSALKARLEQVSIYK